MYLESLEQATSTTLKPSYRNTIADGHIKSPEWRTIVHNRLPCIENDSRPTTRKSASKPDSRSPMQHVMLTICAGQT